MQLELGKLLPSVFNVPYARYKRLGHVVQRHRVCPKSSTVYFPSSACCVVR